METLKCAVSKLDIHIGEEFFMFIVSRYQQNINIATVYPDSNANIFSSVIRCIYAEGKIQVLEEPKYLFNFIKKIEYKDINSDDKYIPNNLDDFINNMGKIYHQSLYYKIYFYPFFVSRNIYLSLMNNFYNRMIFNEKISLYEILERYLIQKQKQIKEIFLKAKESIIDIFSDNSDEEIFDFSMIHFSELVHTYNEPSMIPKYIDFLGKKLVFNDDNEIFIIIIDFIIWSYIMHKGRMGFIGYSGKGSQDNEMMIQRIISEEILKAKG